MRSLTGKKRSLISLLTRKWSNSTVQLITSRNFIRLYPPNQSAKSKNIKSNFMNLRSKTISPNCSRSKKISARPKKKIILNIIKLNSLTFWKIMELCIPKLKSQLKIFSTTWKLSQELRNQNSFWHLISTKKMRLLKLSENLKVYCSLRIMKIK